MGREPPNSSQAPPASTSTATTARSTRRPCRRPWARLVMSQTDVRGGWGVEQALDDLAGTTRDPAVLLAQLGRAGVERAGEAHEVVALGQRVVGRALDEIPPVPRALAEAVGLGEEDAVGVVDCAG